MQLKHVGSSNYQIQGSGGQSEHIKGLEQALGSLSTTEDLVLHCQNKSAIRTNKMPLVLNSNLFAKMLTETCPSALSPEYDVICPGILKDKDFFLLILVQSDFISRKNTKHTSLQFRIFPGPTGIRSPVPWRR